MENTVLTDDFSAGRSVPLSIASSVRREWKINRLNDFASIAELEAEFADCRGYEFEWGQIIESLTDPNEAAEDGDPRYPGASWDFVLVNLHNEFLDAGHNLEQLSDLAVCTLERIRDFVLSELIVGESWNVLPPYIAFDDGDSISAFEVWVRGIENIERARQWIASFFIPGILPLVILRLQAESRAAASQGPGDAVSPCAMSCSADRNCVN